MNGILNLHKPEGMSSFLAVKLCRGIFKTKKAGHAGTLDPLATGVLPILIGNACGAASHFLAEEKEYQATFRVGIHTDTEDVTGTVTAQSPIRPTLEDFKAAAERFLGETLQTPPMYSALKKDGRPLYELARRGEEVEREARPIFISAIEVEPTQDAEVFSLRVACSKGTYIRTLICDLAKAAGTLAVMETLCRTRHGAFALSKSVTMDELKALSDDPDKLAALLLPVEQAFLPLEKIILPAFYARLLRHGAEIYPARARVGKHLLLGDRVRVCDEDGTFLALGELREFEEGVAIKPIKLFL